MKGLLVVNNFVESYKFRELYDLLSNSASKVGVELSFARTGDIPHNIDSVRRIDSDFILFWDKDVLLAEMFEICGFRVFNSASSIYWCDNKAYTGMKLQQNGIRIPKTFIAPITFENVGYNDLQFAYSIAQEIGYPLIIKETYGSFGAQVYLAHNEIELNQIVKKIGYKGFLLQEYVESSSGRDIRINVVGNEVVSSMLRYSVNGDFRSNISNGGSMEKYDASEAQKNIALSACRALNLDFAGVDVLFGTDGEPIICEVNSNPHFKSSLECTGVDMSINILDHIKKCMA